MNDTAVFSKGGKTADDRRWHPGERARVSGKYAIVDSSGNVTSSTRFVTKDEPFPPTPRKGETYSFVKEVVTVYASAASASVIDETLQKRYKALKELAKK